VTVLFFYDGLLTLPKEIELIWRRKIRLGSVLYLIARSSIFMLLGFIVVVDTGIPAAISSRVSLSEADFKMD